MGLSLKTPPKAVAPAKAAEAKAPATAAVSNTDAKGALAASQTPMAQVVEQFKQGIPDVGALYDLISKLSAAEKADIAKNPGYLAQIDARSVGSDLGMAILGELGMGDAEPEEGEAPAAAAPVVAPPAPAKAVS